MSDLISKREAIAAIRKHELVDLDEKRRWYNHGLMDAEIAILDVPSAQRDTDEWCHDCSEYDQDRHCCPRWNRVIRETLKDAEIIRCKDCVYYDPTDNDEEESDWCHVWGDTTEGNAFCSYAERKGEQP